MTTPSVPWHTHVALLRRAVEGVVSDAERHEVLSVAIRTAEECCKWDSFPSTSQEEASLAVECNIHAAKVMDLFGRGDEVSLEKRLCWLGHVLHVVEVWNAEETPPATEEIRKELGTIAFSVATTLAADITGQGSTMSGEGLMQVCDELVRLCATLKDFAWINLLWKCLMKTLQTRARDLCGRWNVIHVLQALLTHIETGVTMCCPSHELVDAVSVCQSASRVARFFLVLLSTLCKHYAPAVLVHSSLVATKFIDWRSFFVSFATQNPEHPIHGIDINTFVFTPLDTILHTLMSTPTPDTHHKVSLYRAFQFPVGSQTSDPQAMSILHFLLLLHRNWIEYCLPYPLALAEGLPSVMTAVEHAYEGLLRFDNTKDQPLLATLYSGGALVFAGLSAEDLPSAIAFLLNNITHPHILRSVLASEWWSFVVRNASPAVCVQLVRQVVDMISTSAMGPAAERLMAALGSSFADLPQAGKDVVEQILQSVTLANACPPHLPPFFALALRHIPLTAFGGGFHTFLRGIFVPACLRRAHEVEMVARKQDIKGQIPILCSIVSCLATIGRAERLMDDSQIQMSAQLSLCLWANPRLKCAGLCEVLLDLCTVLRSSFSGEQLLQFLSYTIPLWTSLPSLRPAILAFVGSTGDCFFEPMLETRVTECTTAIWHHAFAATDWRLFHQALEAFSFFARFTRLKLERMIPEDVRPVFVGYIQRNAMEHREHDTLGREAVALRHLCDGDGDKGAVPSQDFVEGIRLIREGLRILASVPNGKGTRNLPSDVLEAMRRVGEEFRAE